MTSRKINKQPSADIMAYFDPKNEKHIFLMKTINKIAGKYAARSPLPFDELQGVGMLAAWEAATRFKKTAKNSFMTYCWTYIEGYMKNEIRGGISRQEKNTSLEERLEMGVDDWSEDLSESLEANVRIKEALACLNEKERFVILERAKGHSLKEVGEMLGARNGGKAVTHVYVLKIERKARKILEAANV